MSEKSSLTTCEKYCLQIYDTPQFIFPIDIGTRFSSFSACIAVCENVNKKNVKKVRKEQGNKTG